jgi:hypothetical protein
VSARVLKWRKEYVVQGNYGYGHGWEDETAEETYREARVRLREYRDNGPGSYRLITRRVRNEVVQPVISS